MNIETIELESHSYPSNLLDVFTYPPKLFVKGSILPSDSNAVAIVGSRKTTPYGEEMAYEFSFFLARHKITIVSGLARGIDTIAHEAALEANGRTIAVLAHGLDRVYPPENKKLSEKITLSGAIISEYPIGTSAKPQFFLARNRIVSGLAKALVVIEGERRSGTLATASYAAQQGREVFALPGRVNDPFSQATHFLINEGARLVSSPQEVLEFMEKENPGS